MKTCTIQTEDKKLSQKLTLIESYHIFKSNDLLQGYPIATLILSSNSLPVPFDEIKGYAKFEEVYKRLLVFSKKKHVRDLSNFYSW